MTFYPRDMSGYGGQNPSISWPNNAKIAVQFVVNYEEGGENNILHGDKASEAFLSEIVGAAAWPEQRHWNMESLYEYGARAGFWRLHSLFTSTEVPVTVFGVATALERAPLQVKAMIEADWEIASHGLKWIEHKDMPPEEERSHIQQALSLHKKITGSLPQGWYTGRCSMNTVELVAQEAELLYQSDSYADDVPYWHETGAGAQLMVPYTLDANDMRFATAQGFNTGEQFFTYLKDSFDALYEEGQQGSPKMMSIGLHCRLAGRPGRIQALKAFIDYAKSHQDVWFAKRADIARYWHENHPYQPKLRPSMMDKDTFMEYFGGVFEHSPWIAQAVFDGEKSPTIDNLDAFHLSLCVPFRAAARDKRLAVLNAHPDLAGKLAIAQKLTAESTAEQASAGLDKLNADEFAKFTQLNDAYKAKFGHPFIIAVKGLSKEDILQAFVKRIEHDEEAEFTEACLQVEKIAYLRLKDLFEQV